MAPKRQKQAKLSSDSQTLTRPQTVATKSPARTPIQSPRRREGGITVAQKQALMDNLQLEVTERARKLRAQYALQSQSLRTRIELRVNRVPTALRKANMGDLLERYRQMQEAKASEEDTETKAKLEGKRAMGKPQSQASPARARGVKRTSDEMSSNDKENANSASDMALPNPKKRAKPTNAMNGREILSPKSGNSRTLPRGTQQNDTKQKPESPQKPTSSRPTSPLKAGLPPSPVKATGTVTAANNMLSDMLSNSRAPAPSNARTANKSTKTQGARAKAPTNTASGLVRNPSAASSTSTVATGAKGVGRRVNAAAAASQRQASNTSTLSTTSISTTIVSKAGNRAPASNRTAATSTTGPKTGGRLAKKVGGAATTNTATAGRTKAKASTVATIGGTGAGENTGRRVLRKR